MQNSSPFSLGSLLGFIANNFVLLLVGAILLGGGFYGGSLWTENQILKNGGAVGGVAPSLAGDDVAPAGPTGPSEDQLSQVPEVTADDHIRGSRDAKVILVEYSDFECPFCSRFHPTTKQVLDEYGDDVALVYRHYPLSFHPNAQAAAETSECVAKLGGDEAFWSFADAIFAEQDALGGRLNEDAIATAVSAAGVDAGAVDTCVESGEMADVVNEHFTTGGAAGVSGTPGTFIVTEDGAQELIPGALPFEQVKTLIDNYL